MALAATHLLIAFDLASVIHFDDEIALYVGTLYPDSRYATGIPREHTHGKNHVKKLMRKGYTDFHAGWAMHLRYDEISGEFQKALMPKHLVLSQERDEAWAYFTAIKVAEDIFSAAVHGPALQLLTSLTIDQAPNNEPIEVLQAYYASITELYKFGVPSLDQYRAFFAAFPMPENVLDEIMRVATSLTSDPKTLPVIQRIYHETQRVLISDYTDTSRRRRM